MERKRDLMNIVPVRFGSSRDIEIDVEFETCPDLNDMAEDSFGPARSLVSGSPSLQGIDIDIHSEKIPEQDRTVSYAHPPSFAPRM